MRFAILAVVVVVMLLALVGGCFFVLMWSRSSMPVMVQSSPQGGSVDSASVSVQTSGTALGVQFSKGSVGAKIWRDGKRVLFEVDGSGLEIELGAEDGTFDFTKLRENLDTIDKSFSPAGGSLQEIVLEVGEGVPAEAVGELARTAKDRGMHGVKVDGALVPTEKDD